MLSIANRYESNNTQLYQLYHECLHIQQDILEEASSSKCHEEHQDKLACLYEIVPKAFEISLQSRLICDALYEAHKILKLAQANTLQKIILYVKGKTLESAKSSDVRIKRHKKGYALLEAILGKDCLQLDKLWNLFCGAAEAGKSRRGANSKTTRKVIERLLSIVEKLVFIMEFWNSTKPKTDGDVGDSGKAEGTLYDKLQSSKFGFDSREYKEAAGLLRLDGKFDLYRQHKDFVTQTKKHLNQMF